MNERQSYANGIRRFTNAQQPQVADECQGWADAKRAWETMRAVTFAAWVETEIYWAEFEAAIQMEAEKEIA